MSRTRVVKVVRQRAPIAAVPAPAPLVWTEQQCMAALGIGQTTLAEWRRDGMPHVKRGRVLLFVADDVVQWLRAQSATVRRVG